MSATIEHNVTTRSGADLLNDDSLPEREVAQSADGGFVAYASKGPVAPGHLIVVPRFRAYSIALATRYREAENDLQKFVERLSILLSKEYEPKPILFFEHGMSECGLRESMCGTTQAHLHMVPSSVSLLERSSELGLKFQPVASRAVARSVVENGFDYLFIEEHGQKYIRALRTREDLPSQFFRRLLLENSDLRDEWDWMRYPRDEMMMETVGRIRRLVNHDYNTPADWTPIELEELSQSVWRY